MDEGAADVEFAAGFAPAAAIWRVESETDALCAIRVRSDDT